MNETTIVQFRVDGKLKTEVAEILEGIGIDLPTGLRMFMRRVVLDRGLPFSATLPEKPMAEGSLDSPKRVIMIPGRKLVRIPSDVVEHLVRQVPAGKITRMEDIQQVLQMAYGCECVELEHVSVMVSLRDETYPYWRVVGTRGFLPSRHRDYSDETMAAKLRAEGLAVSKGGANKALYRVDNYKDHLFDFSGIQLMTEEN